MIKIKQILTLVTSCALVASTAVLVISCRVYHIDGNIVEGFRQGLKKDGYNLSSKDSSGFYELTRNTGIIKSPTAIFDVALQAPSIAHPSIKDFINLATTSTGKATPTTNYQVVYKSIMNSLAAGGSWVVGETPTTIPGALDNLFKSITPTKYRSFYDHTYINPTIDGKKVFSSSTLPDADYLNDKSFRPYDNNTDANANQALWSMTYLTGTNDWSKLTDHQTKGVELPFAGNSDAYIYVAYKLYNTRDSKNQVVIPIEIPKATTYNFRFRLAN